MPDPVEPPGDTPPGDRSSEDRPEGLVHRVVRSVIAPDVLEDGGHDAPMSPRGRLLFYAIVAILVVGIVVLLLVTASSR